MEDTKQKCGHTNKECGYINFTNDVCDLMEKHSIKGVCKLEEKLNALKLLIKCGIALVVPESEYLNNERLTIQLYKKHTTKEQWEKLLELFDIK